MQMRMILNSRIQPSTMDLTYVNSQLAKPGIFLVFMEISAIDG
jgi:hypothetical protein